jgi:iron complex outermembrane receptor protein
MFSDLFDLPSLARWRARPCPLAVVAALVVALAPTAATAQTDRGTVTGQVRDSLGGALPGTTVRVIDDVNGAIVEVVTDALGSYRVAVETGRYRVEASLDGFETAVRQVQVAPAQTQAADLTLAPARINEGVVVTARRVEEIAQEVPVPISVLSGELVANAGAFNINRVKELIPTVQFYSSNPRNSSVTIRGLGAPFGLTNDGIEPGVGLYIDGVFYARPAAATLDFLDVERVEVLRGPQGTLFGKNTTAGAINVTSRRPGFRPETDFELAVGSYDFLQAKGSISGPLSKSVAGRVSVSATGRGGLLLNARTQDHTNTLNNTGVRGQLLFAPSRNLAITAAVDYTRQRPDGYAQVVTSVAPTLRPANQQYAQIAKDLGYTPPSWNAFDRLIDTDTRWQSNQDLAGASLTVDLTVGPGRLTSTTAWRLWNWDPSSDRDFIGLPVTTVSAAPSKQRQWTQEIRYAGALSSHVNFVAGGFAFQQSIDSDPAFKQEQGAAAARFFLAPSPLVTPGLLDGYGFKQYVTYQNVSAALFGQLEWSITDRVKALTGLRLNYDQKNVDFNQQVYGGLQTDNPALVALKLSVLSPQAYAANVDDTNTSGQVTLAYRIARSANGYATYSTGFKSVGLNLNGLPTDALGRPILSAATVKPEDVHHLEVGLKTEPLQGVTANVTVFDTQIKDFQTQVVNAQVGVLRGYLANADKVRVRGAEFDGSAKVSKRLSLYGAAAYTDGVYVSFRDAPPPIEEIGGPQFKDISGSLLPGLSKWAFTLSGEYSTPATVIGQAGELFGGLDSSYRSSFSSSPSVSKYMMVDGFGLLNARVGFRSHGGWSLLLWSRNLLDKNYFEFLTAAPGGSGLIVGLPGDPRTVGLTLRVSFKK